MRNIGWIVMGLLLMMGACGQEVDEGTLEGDGKTVTVSYRGEDHLIELSRADVVSFGGEDHAVLSSVILLALGDLEAMEVDFRGADGFQPATKEYCQDLIPLSGEDLTKGYIHPVSRNLVWDESLMYPGCLHVDDLEEILVSDR